MKSKPVRLVAALVLATTALAGCGSAGTAAVVGDRTITEDEARTAAEQIQVAYAPPAGFPTAQALSMLIVAPTVLEVSKAKGIVSSESQARYALAHPQEVGSQGKPVGDPTPETVQLVEVASVLERLTDADRATVLEDLKREHIEVNPRYGSFDTSSGSLKATAPAWIRTAPMPGVEIQGQ